MPSKDERSLTRRELLRLGRMALIGTGFISLYPIGRYLTFVRHSASRVKLASSKVSLDSTWQRIEKSRFWLRKTKGQMEGIWATCTHLGCEVYFEESIQAWICPCHGSRYNVEGYPTTGPAKKPLALFKVDDQGGYYYLDPPGRV